MNKFIIYSLLSLAGVCSCQKSWFGATGQYYAPTIFVNGQEEESMLTTVFASLDITPKGNGSVDISIDFRGGDYYRGGGLLSVTGFQVNLPGVTWEEQGTSAIFSGKDIEAELSYTTRDARNLLGQGSIVRKFQIDGTVDKRDQSKSTVTVSSVIFDKVFSISLSQITANQSDAEFGKMGYPSFEAEVIHANRVFVNDTDHRVIVEHIYPFSNEEKTTITAKGKGTVLLFDDEDNKPSYYLLSFDDGRQSRHDAEETRFYYNGLPVQVMEQPLLFCNYGQICYDINYNCTYTITPEIFNAAVFPSE